MQQRIVNSTVENLVNINKIVSMVTDFSGLENRIKPINVTEFEFITWSDASFANAAEKKSQGGYIVCATQRSLRQDKWAMISPLRWRNFNQERQVASTLGAELLSLSPAIAETKWLRSFWTEAMCSGYTLESDRERAVRYAITMAIDSRPAYDHLNGQALSIKDKCLAIEMLLVK